jgi:hypothetical protein
MGSAFLDRNGEIRIASPNPLVMNRDFFDPSPEEQQVVLIDAKTLRKAEKLIESCEQCKPEDVAIPFDNILDRVTGSDPSGRTTFSKRQRSVRTAAARFWKRLSLSRCSIHG